MEQGERARLEAELAAHPAALAAWRALAPSHQAEWLRYVTEARRAETRTRRRRKVREAMEARAAADRRRAE
ncbi:YdeI/OmpD-associated family protein [Oceanithermus sp.]|uniref:YdeI/OmpD-associated family protein n=1 Tax=Oceanithermus sp. TaxID=2268145 RepID=UPI002579C5C5|nr:YdeI/OmpD-associated family protein [Oceanithermus sp.]